MYLPVWAFEHRLDGPVPADDGDIVFQGVTVDLQTGVSLELHAALGAFISLIVANCLILTFRAVARGARLEWNAMKVAVDGKLDRVDKVTRFTDFFIKAELRVPAGTDVSKAEHMVQRAESVCLVTN